MPKKREDLEVPAFRIVDAIKANDLSSDPPKLRVDFVPFFGRQVLEIRRPFRIRLPFRTTKLAALRGQRNNRMTIPTSYLVLRWKELTDKSPLWYLAQQAQVNPKHRYTYGLYLDTETETWMLLTYQVVQDMNTLRRQFIHIFAQYQQERTETTKLQTQIEQQLIDDFVLGNMTAEARKALERFQRWMDRREIEMGTIGAVLAGRNFIANFYAEKSQRLLQAVANNLRLLAGTLPKLPANSWAGFQIRLEKELDKLDTIVSPNVLSQRRQAQRKIRRAITVMRENPLHAAGLLTEAGNICRKAAGELEKWAASISQEEMEEAQRYLHKAS